MKHVSLLRCLILLGAFALMGWGVDQAAQRGWVRVSSRSGELPAPGTSREQTGVLVGRFDLDSPATDFVMSFRVVGPALVWYRRVPDGWSRYVIEPQFLMIEAGGAVYDIDGDGDADIVFGNDWQGNKLSMMRWSGTLPGNSLSRVRRNLRNS
jgi:hypothetical protein